MGGGGGSPFYPLLSITFQKNFYLIKTTI